MLIKNELLKNIVITFCTIYIVHELCKIYAPQKETR